MISNSEFKFTLIDYGMLSKFKINKTNNMYEDHFGNLKYCSIRGLKHM